MKKAMPLKCPNLPHGTVRSMLVGSDVAGLLSKLVQYGIEPVVVPPCGDVPFPVRSHPDMLLHHLGGRDIVVYAKIAEFVEPQLKRLGFNVIASRNILNPAYPGDIALNSARIGNFVFCNVKNTDEAILDYYRKHGIITLDVKQGYSKCSMLTADENSLITSDLSIASKAEENGLNVLKIERGYIELPGYDYGFIGGCCGKISKDKIIFSGNIEAHPEYEKIRIFLSALGIEIISITNQPLWDVGGIIPLTEEMD